MAGIDKAAMVWTMAIVAVGAGFAIAGLSFDQSQTPISETTPESRGGIAQQEALTLNTQSRLADISDSISIEFDKASYRMSDKVKIKMIYDNKIYLNAGKIDKINVDLSLTSIGHTAPILLTESGVNTGVFKTSFCRDNFGLSPLKVSHKIYPDSVYDTADLKPLRSSDSDSFIKFKKESNIRAIETVGWVITSKDDRLELTRDSRTGDQPIDFYDIKIKNCGISHEVDPFSGGEMPPMWAFTGFNGGYVTVTLDYDYEKDTSRVDSQPFQASNKLRIDYKVDSLEIPNSNVDTSGDRTLQIFKHTDGAYAALTGFAGDIRDFDSVSTSKKFVVRLYDPSRDHGLLGEILEFATEHLTDYVINSLTASIGIPGFAPVNQILALGIDCPAGQTVGQCLRESADEQDIIVAITSESKLIPHFLLLEKSDSTDKVYVSNPIKVSDITNISGDKIIVFYKNMHSALKIN